ncbi:MAG: putative toxin-antitoxin system toxin component, PIN family [Planctomycetota bacterium]
MKLLRVVLDTNIVISALLFSRGKLSWLREAWQAGQFIPLVSKDSALEIIRVLAYPKFKLSTDAQNELIADYLPWCETVCGSENPRKLPECRDEFDVPFLKLAHVGKADFLVSGDKDLLVLAPQFEIPIVSADEFQRYMKTTDR